MKVRNISFINYGRSVDEVSVIIMFLQITEILEKRQYPNKIKVKMKMRRIRSKLFCRIYFLKILHRKKLKMETGFFGTF